MRKENRNEDAVSPVIGVMLLLVVTVVIAAVVVGFSTGLAGSTGTTPTALFEVSGTETWAGTGDGEELSYLNIRHKGGDTIPLSDLQITLTSVGGSNSGITQVFLASDAKTRLDTEEGTFHPPTMTQDEYNAEKENYLQIAKQNVVDAEEMLEFVLNDPQWASWVDMYKEGLEEAKAMLEQMEIQFKNIYDKDLYGYFEGGDTYPLAVLGQTTPTKSLVSTGDIIHVSPRDKSDGSSAIYAGTGVKWTISYIPTNSVIAKGEFEVIAD